MMPARGLGRRAVERTARVRRASAQARRRLAAAVCVAVCAWAAVRAQDSRISDSGGSGGGSDSNTSVFRSVALATGSEAPEVLRAREIRKMWGERPADVQDGHPHVKVRWRRNGSHWFEDPRGSAGAVRSRGAVANDVDRPSKRKTRTRAEMSESNSNTDENGGPADAGLVHVETEQHPARHPAETFGAACMTNMTLMRRDVEYFKATQSDAVSDLRGVSTSRRRLNLREANFIGSIVIPEHKILLCTIPKNACSLLRRYALRLRNESSRSFHDTSVTPSTPSPDAVRYWTKNAQIKRAHLELRMLPVDEIERIRTDPSWLKVAFVRNPYTRALSAYLDKLVLGKMRVGSAGSKATFAQFVDELVQHKPGLLNEHFRDQVDMCAFNAVSYDIIGKTEQLEHDLRCVSSARGLEHAVTSGWGRRSLVAMSTGHETHANRLLHQYYTPQIAAKLFARFRDDFLAFGYPPELPHIRHLSGDRV